jgi:hypothetical protein
MERIFRIRIVLALGFCVLLGFSLIVSAQEEKMKSLLQKPFDLSPAYKVGDKNYYNIETIYLEMNDEGKVTQTRILNGYFSREVVDIEENERADFFAWKFVKMGVSEGKGEVNEYAVLPYTCDFKYTFKEWTHQKFPVNLSSIPKTIDGWRFVVKLLDAHTFDVIADFAGVKEKLVHISDTAIMPADTAPVMLDFPPLYTDTHFQNEPVHITFHGVTLYKNQPCAIIAFRCDDAKVQMVVNINDMKVPTKGVSCYSGEVFLSLKSHKIAWGKIIERVDHITTVPNLSAPIRHVTRREITLDSMDKNSF